MNRLEEYEQLHKELMETPMELEYTVTRAKARLKKRKHLKRIIMIPASTLLSIFLIFMISVNVSPQFASACEKIPIIGDLAQAVQFSDTLSKAVENEYYQTVDITKSQDGVTLNVKYLMADEENLCIFYTISSKQGGHYFYDPKVYTTDGKDLEGVIGNTGTKEDLRIKTINFSKTKMPKQLVLDGDVVKITDKFQKVSSFKVELNIDQSKIVKTQELEVNKSFMIGNQKFMVEKAFISPLALKLQLSQTSSNKKTLNVLNFYVIDEKNRQYGFPYSTGSKTGSSLTFYTGSPYFEDVKQLTMVVEGASFSGKDDARIEVDLNNKKASNLPEFAELVGVVNKNGVRNVTIGVNTKGLLLQSLVSDEYYGKNGEKYHISTTQATQDAYTRGNGNENTYASHVTETYDLDKENNDTIYLIPNYTSIEKLETPLKIDIK